MNNSARLDFASHLHHASVRHEQEVNAAHYGIRLTGLDGEPLTPIAIEPDDTSPDEFYAQYVLGGPIARVDLRDDERGNVWHVTTSSARSLGHVLYGSGYFLPFGPQGQPLTSQETLVDALRVVLDRAAS